MRKTVSVAGIILAVLAIICHVFGIAADVQPYLTDGGVILVGFSVVVGG